MVYFSQLFVSDRKKTTTWTIAFTIHIKHGWQLSTPITPHWKVELSNAHGSLFLRAPQELQDMNARRINKYKELVASHAECHRSVFPVINTCLNNITGASNSIDPDKVHVYIYVHCKV